MSQVYSYPHQTYSGSNWGFACVARRGQTSSVADCTSKRNPERDNNASADVPHLPQMRPLLPQSVDLCFVKGDTDLIEFNPLLSILNERCVFHCFSFHAHSVQSFFLHKLAAIKYEQVIRRFNSIFERFQVCITSTGCAQMFNFLKN